MNNGRSVSITILGIVYLLFAVLLFIFGYSSFFGQHPELSTNTFFQGGLFFIALYHLIAGIGILMLRNWARYLVFVFNSITLILLFIKLIKGLPFASKDLLSIIFYVGVIYFLARAKVKEQFK